MSDREGVRVWAVVGRDGKQRACGGFDNADEASEYQVHHVPGGSIIECGPLSLGATAAPRTDALMALVQWIGENTLLETHEGEAIFLHADSCLNFCDYACNEPGGSEKAKEFNALLSAVAAPAAPGATDALRERDEFQRAEGYRAGYAVGFSAKESAPVASAGTAEYAGPLPCFEGGPDHRDVAPGAKCPGCEYVAERQHEADATPDRDTRLREVVRRAGEMADPAVIAAAADRFAKEMAPPASTEPVAPAPDLPPGYTIREATNRDATLLKRPYDPDYEEAWIDRSAMRRSAWAEYGRAAWQSARPDREVMDLLRECRDVLISVQWASNVGAPENFKCCPYCTGCYPSDAAKASTWDTGHYPSCTIAALLARLARALGEGR